MTHASRPTRSSLGTRTLRLAITLALLVPIVSLRAQQPAQTPAAQPIPEIAPSPVASPAASPSADPDAASPSAPQATPVASPAATPLPATPLTAPTPPAPVPTPAPTPTPTLRDTVDAMSAADLQEAISVLKSGFIHPDQLADQELSKALLEGVLIRLGAGASLVPAAAAPTAHPPAPFYAEILDGRIGYLRLGSLAPENLDQLDASLENFAEKNITSAVLDLRSTPPDSDFDQAVEVLRRFVPKGKLLFTIRRPSDKQERIFTSNQDPKFTGLVTVLVDGENSGASEVIAAALHAQAGAMNVGSSTAGRAVEYAERRLPSGQLIRYAVAEVVLADGSRVFPDGITPDLEVTMSEKNKRQIMRLSLEKGVSQFVFDKERPRMNEAALVAGTNPALDAFTDEESDNPDGTKHLRDIVLQRAVDLITTIAIFQDSKK